MGFRVWGRVWGLGRFMGTYSPNYKFTYSLLGGLGGLVSKVIIGVVSTLNLQVGAEGLG